MPELQKSLDTKLHPSIEQLLIKRGYLNQDISEFLSWDLNKLPLLTELKDLSKAAERIIVALKNKENIGIYGDYDVDGTTSCALFYHFFKMLGVETKLFQPSRFIEGYGVHNSSVDDALAQGVDLLITVDCGISNVETAEYAKEKGLTLIITDHHKDGRETMPDAYAVVNPNRRDEDLDSPLTALAGVGVAFCVCLKVREILNSQGRPCPSLYPLLQFVAIGTICDMAFLNPMNLKLSRHGLKQIPSSVYPGLRAFLNTEDRKLDVLASDKVSFNIGPMINSKGRLDHPEVALNLLVGHDSDEAWKLYNQLENSNNERKFIQKQVFDEAKKQAIETFKFDQDPCIQILYAPHWHEGVIGIVASKIVESFGLPTLIFTDSEHEGIIKASARSAGDLNIYELLQQCQDLFLKFGGHKAAAGLSMKAENLKDLRLRLKESLIKIPLITRTVQQNYDLEVKYNDLTPDLVKGLEKLEPFGNGNQRPVFQMNDFVVENYKILKDAHVKWNFVSVEGPVKRLQGISFNYLGKWSVPSPDEIIEAQLKGQILTATFTLGINRFRGNEFIQLMVDKITF